MARPHWIRRTHLFDADAYTCSVCGSSFPRPTETCPRCGTDMRETKYDPSWVDEAAIMDIILGDK